MKFWNKKKSLSSLRYCSSPFELPYERIFRDHSFNVEISELKTWRRWPHVRDSEPVACGIVQNGSRYPDAEAPDLPVEVRFIGKHSSSDKIVTANFNKYSLSGHGYDTYVLYVFITDVDGSIFQLFRESMSRAISSNRPFLVLTLGRPLSKKIYTSDEHRSMRNMDIDLLMKLESADGDLGSVPLEWFSIEDRLETKSPIWTRRWVDDRNSRSEKVAKWREEYLPLRKIKKEGP